MGAESAEREGIVGLLRDDDRMSGWGFRELVLGQPSGLIVSIRDVRVERTGLVDRQKLQYDRFSGGACHHRLKHGRARRVIPRVPESGRVWRVREHEWWSGYSSFS